jgi:uncharacterized protein YraI
MKPATFVCLAMSCFFQPVPLSAQTEAPPEPIYQGRVTGDDVHIRSGPDTNYYSLGRANKGQTVQVIAEQFGWLKILPLPGMYSLIEKNYLDTTADGRGVVNADRVNIRAGADDVPYVYARQLKLNRGAEVRILGEREATLNGQTVRFYRIEPPPGAYVWIHADFVERTDGRTGTSPAPAEKQPTREDTARVSAAVRSGAGGESEPPVESDSAPPAQTAPEKEELRTRLAELDARFKAEFDKPLDQRDFEQFREPFAALADQDADRVVKRFAELRLEQVEYRIKMLETIRSLREDESKLEELRQEYMQARAEIRISAIDAPRNFEWSGQLRESNIYNTPLWPKRYRLVDPDRKPAHTLAYIEIPPDFNLDVQALVGRYVGIVEASRSYHKGLVQAVPIIVPSDIVVIDRPTKPQVEAPNPGEPETQEQPVEEQQPQTDG